MERKTKITLFTIGAVVGGGYLLYEFLLKDLFKPKISPDTTSGGNAIDAGAMLPPPNIPFPEATPAPIVIQVQPSPMGTPDNKLKWNTLKMDQGMRGAEIKRAQELLNAISKIYGTSQIATDGVFGPITRAKMDAIVGTGPKTLTQVYDKYKSVKK